MAHQQYENQSTDIWIIKSRISGRILDAATTYVNAKQRCEVMNRIYQTDEYIVQKFIEGTFDNPSVIRVE